MKVLILLFFMTTVEARSLDKLPCAKELKAQAQEWEIGKKAGEWIVVRELPQGSVISKTNSEGRMEVVFKTPACTKEAKFYPHPKLAKKKATSVRRT